MPTRKCLSATRPTWRRIISMLGSPLHDGQHLTGWTPMGNLRLSLSVRWFGVLLGLLVAVGVGLRIHNLNQRRLWGDELGTLSIAQFYPFLPEAGQLLYRRIQVRQIGDGDTFLTAKAAEQSPPLNDLLEKATVNWLGATEVAARLPAALAACALL